MIKVKMLTNGKIMEVTRNIAHDLIDRGLAVIAVSADIEKVMEAPVDPVEEVAPRERNNYMHRQMRPSRPLR